MASPVIWGTIIGTFCYMYFVYFCLTWMPAYFVERRNLSLTSMGLYTFFSFGGMATMAALAGWAADRMIAGGRNPVNVRKGVHHRRIRHGVHGGDRRVFRFRPGGAVLRGVLSVRTGPRDRQLLGADPDADSRREHRQDRRHSELRREPAGNRGADSYRLAEADDGQLRGADAGDLVLPDPRHRRVFVSSAGKVRAYAGTAGIVDSSRLTTPFF